MVSAAREKLYPADAVKKEKVPSLDTKALSDFQEIKIKVHHIFLISAERTKNNISQNEENELQVEEALDEFDNEIVDVDADDGDGLLTQASILHSNSLNWISNSEYVCFANRRIIPTPIICVYKDWPKSKKRE